MSWKKPFWRHCQNIGRKYGLKTPVVTEHLFSRKLKCPGWQGRTRFPRLALIRPSCDWHRRGKQCRVFSITHLWSSFPLSEWRPFASYSLILLVSSSFTPIPGPPAQISRWRACFRKAPSTVPQGAPFQCSQAKKHVWIRHHNIFHSQILSRMMPSCISTRRIIF